MKFWQKQEKQSLHLWLYTRMLTSTFPFEDILWVNHNTYNSGIRMHQNLKVSWVQHEKKSQ